MKTYNVNYKGISVEVEESETSYTIDFRTGLGSATYEKISWTLEEALEDQYNIFNN